MKAKQLILCFILNYTRRFVPTLSIFLQNLQKFIYFERDEICKCSEKLCNQKYEIHCIDVTCVVESFEIVYYSRNSALVFVMN